MNNVLVATDLSVRFDEIIALDGVSLTIPRGKVVGLIGPSGSGKTTLMRAIVGRQGFSQGSLTVLGQPAGSKNLRSRLSYMTQELSVYADLSVVQNLRYFATMRGLARDIARSSVEELLYLTDMRRQTNQLVGRLSSGQKQRVSLAIALLGNPELMVLDEPTVGLDPVLRDEIWKLFRRLIVDGTSLIISSHVMDEAERCDDLVLIRNGKILAHDTPANLCRQTSSRTVEQSFLTLVGEEK